MKKVVIIGGGVGGLATACIMAKKGYDVSLYEKNKILGGRMNIFKEKGFTFDMGPSWYLMPDIFENFYKLMGEKVKDHLNLVKLSPSYRVFFKGDESVDMYSNLKKDIPTLERLEKGAGENLKKYLTIFKQEIRKGIIRKKIN